jgi:hypothetical protein
MQDKLKATKVTLYLPHELHRQLKIRSAVDGEAMSAIAERALDFYINRAEVVNEYSVSCGQTHRVYNCPGCAESMVMRNGELLTLAEAVSPAQFDSLTMEVAEVVPETSQPEEGELVPC